MGVSVPITIQCDSCSYKHTIPANAAIVAGFVEFPSLAEILNRNPVTMNKFSLVGSRVICEHCTANAQRKATTVPPALGNTAPVLPYKGRGPEYPESHPLHSCVNCGVFHNTCPECGTTHGDSHDTYCRWRRYAGRDNVYPQGHALHSCKDCGRHHGDCPECGCFNGEDHHPECRWTEKEEKT